jgi:hypothetical protein
MDEMCCMKDRSAQGTCGGGSARTLDVQQYLSMGARTPTAAVVEGEGREESEFWARSMNEHEEDGVWCNGDLKVRRRFRKYLRPRSRGASG